MYALIFLASTTQRENKQVTERRLIRSQSSLILLLTVGARGVMGRRKVGQRLVDHFCFPPLKMPLVFCPKRAIQIESTEDKSGKAVYWRSASTIGRLPAVRHNSRCRFCCTHNFCTSAISLSLASLSLSHSASLLVHIRAASSLKIKEKRQQTSVFEISTLQLTVTRQALSFVYCLPNQLQCSFRMLRTSERYLQKKNVTVQTASPFRSPQ